MRISIKKPTLCCGTWFGWIEIPADRSKPGLLHYPDGFAVPFRGSRPFRKPVQIDG